MDFHFLICKISVLGQTRCSQVLAWLYQNHLGNLLKMQVLNTLALNSESFEGHWCGLCLTSCFCMHQCLFQRLKREQLYKLCKSQGEWSAVTLSPSFFDICHLPCIFLAEQDIKITFSLGPKIGWYKINADCISTAGSPEPLPAALFISRSHCKFCHAHQFPEGFITWVFKRDSLILELLEVCFLSIQVMRRESNFSRSLAVHRECVVWTLFYLKKKKKWKQTSCMPALLTWKAASDSYSERCKTVFHTRANKASALTERMHRGINSKTFIHPPLQTKGR